MIGTTSCYCVILKMVILHDAMKPIHIVFFVLFFKKEKRTKACFLYKNKKKIIYKTGGLFSFQKNGFFSTLIILQSFFAIFP